MPKKRLVFTLLYQKGYFYLSRNFRLQRVGNLDWLQNNYKFSSIATSIDELIIVDVTRKEHDKKEFCEIAAKVSANCFIPLVLGGGINSLEDAEMLVTNGADKLIINTALTEKPELVSELVKIYGSQSIIASIDYRKIDGELIVFTHQGQKKNDQPFGMYLQQIAELKVGELYLNSIDRDGTSQGYSMESIKELGAGKSLPVIMAGGAGNKDHLLEGLQCREIDAVATANLFNFIGDGLPNARKHLIAKDIVMARW